MTEKKLHNKNSLITGSTSGIGLGIANKLAEAGSNLVLNGFCEKEYADNLCKELSNKYQVKVIYSEADIRDFEQVEKMVHFAQQQFGSIDILVNNAGIQHVSSIEDFSLDKWNDVIATNLSGAFYTIKACIAMMKKKSFGRIINISSAHGLVASINKSAYVAAKHAIIGLTKAVALESANHNVNCVAISPGWVKTELVMKQINTMAENQNISIEQATKNLLSEKQPNLKFVTSEEIGDLVCFLSGPSGSSITGASFSVDGGWTCV